MVLKIVEYPVTGRISCGGDRELETFLRQHGLWSQRYIASSMPLRGDGDDASELEKCLAEAGKINAKVLADEIHYNGWLDIEFLTGRAAIVIYDAARLEEIGEGKFRRPPVNPSEYVAMVIVPKVQEAVVG